MREEESYAHQLKTLAVEGIRFWCIGTYALKLLQPALWEGYVLHDADIVLEHSEGNIRNFIQIMRKAGWSVSVWNEPVTESVDLNFLKGKFYLRSTRESLTIDATFECPIAYPEMESRGQMLEGVPLAHLDHIMALRALKGQS
jgi:hypothetical protein